MTVMTIVSQNRICGFKWCLLEFVVRSNTRLWLKNTFHDTHDGHDRKHQMNRRHALKRCLLDRPTELFDVVPSVDTHRERRAHSKHRGDFAALHLCMW